MSKRKKRKKEHSKSKSQSKREQATNKKARPRMEIASYFLGILGAVGLAICGILYNSHKIPSIWIFFASVVALALGGCLYWQHSVEAAQEETEYHGLLRPDNKPTPSNPCEGLMPIPADALLIFMGNSVGMTTHFPHIVIRVVQDDVLAVDRRENGEVAINAKVFSTDGRIIAEIRNNEFYINQNNYFRKERPDSHSLIVYDQMDRRVLDVEYLNPRAIRFAGIFSHPNHEEIVVSSSHGPFANRQCYGENRAGDVWFH